MARAPQRAWTLKAPHVGGPSLDRIWAPALLDRDPAKLRELLQGRPAAEAPPAARLDASEGHLRLVVHGGSVDVAHSALDPASDRERGGHVPPEDRGREAVFGVVGDSHRLVWSVHLDHADDRRE